MTDNEETYRQRYQRAVKRMQTGVAFVMERDKAETSPKQLRVGINSAMSEAGGLVGVLIAKGIITREEYFKAIAESMEREADAYEQRLSDVFGVKVTTGATIEDVPKGALVIHAKSDPPPVDRSQRTMADGSPETPDHREINPATGQQKGYVVLSEAERAKGFVRPLRMSYLHTTCGGETIMALALAETYARDPKFYSSTWCCACRKHAPVDEFRWGGTDQVLGS